MKIRLLRLLILLELRRQGGQSTYWHLLVALWTALKSEYPDELPDLTKPDTLMARIEFYSTLCDLRDRDCIELKLSHEENAGNVTMKRTGVLALQRSRLLAYITKEMSYI